MSDGFQEMFNPAGEVLGEERAFQAFQESANRSANDVISYLVEYAEAWAAGHPQKDDLTFMVIKMK